MSGSPVTREQLARLAQRVDTFDAEQIAALGAGLGGLARERAARDGLFFLKFVQTRDEADPLAPAKPFPLDKPFVTPVWTALSRQKKVVIAKSRQMLMSWIIAAYVIHRARFTPNQAIYFQLQDSDDAKKMVALATGGAGFTGFEGRCQFIESHLPAWLAVRYRTSEGKLIYSNGSMIEALAGGADKIRSKVFSIYVGDEFAFQDQQDGVYTAVSPLIQKGAQVIFCSTPNGTSNQFCTLYHGFPVTDGQVPA